MTYEELLSEADAAAEAGEDVALPGADLQDLVAMLLDQDAQIDAAWLALGITPVDAPGAGELAAAISRELDQARNDLEAQSAEVYGAWSALGRPDVDRAAPGELAAAIRARMDSDAAELKRRETVGRARLLLALLKKFENNPKISVTIRNVARELP